MTSLVIVNALDGFFAAFSFVGQVIAILSAALTVGAQLFSAVGVSAIGGVAWLVGLMLSVGAAFMEDWFAILVAAAAGVAAGVLVIVIDLSRTMGERLRSRLDDEGAALRQAAMRSVAAESA